MPVYLNGLLLGLSLIMALGPQNIFLIRQGAMRNHATLSAVICFISDVILITGSVTGLGHVLESHARYRVWMICFGACFLIYYGGTALKRTVSISEKSTKMEAKPRLNRWQIMVFALGFSLLNPHAILDSVVLIGGSSGQFPGKEYAFLSGVLSSSLLWFSSLTLTTHYFSDLLCQAHIWRRVEFAGGVLMVILGIKLISSLCY